MRSLGYREGDDITFEFRTTPGDPAASAAFATELVRMPVDIIVTDSTPSVIAASKATTTIPIIMAVLGIDPVEAKLVASYARPGGNITGFTILAPELGPKRLEILKRWCRA